MRLKGIRRGISFILTAGLITGCMGCGKNDEVPKLLAPVSAEKEYVTAEYGQISSRTYYEAYVTPDILTVSFDYDGILKECCKVCGDRVEEGEVLAELRTEELDAEISVGNKELAFLKTDYEYDVSLATKQIQMDQIAISMNYSEVTRLDQAIGEAKALLEEKQNEMNAGTVSGNLMGNDTEEISVYEEKISEYEMQRYGALESINDSMHSIGLNSAKTEADTGLYGVDVRECADSLSKLLERKDSAVIKSPCKGRVVGAVSAEGEQAKEGDNVKAHEAVYYIADESKVYFTVEELTDRDAGNNMEAYVIIDGREYPLVRAAYSTELKKRDHDFIDATWGEEGSLPARFVAEDEGAMKNLQFGDFYQIVVVDKQADHVLYVPNDALYRETEGSYVIRVDEDGKETKVNVEIGLITDYYTEIKGGIEAGDKLLSKGLYFDLGNLEETELVSGNYVIEETFSKMIPTGYKNERVLSMAETAKLGELKINSGDVVKEGDTIAVLDLYSHESELTEQTYRLETADREYDDAIEALNKQKTILTGRIYELQDQNDTSGQIGLLQLQISYMDTLIAQMNARRNYEKELIKDNIDHLNEEAALKTVKAGSSGTVSSITGTGVGKSIAQSSTICIIQGKEGQALRIEDEGKLKYNMKVEITGSLNGEEVTLTGRVVAADNIVPVWVYNTAAYDGFAVVKPDTDCDLSGFVGKEAKAESRVYENAYVVSQGMVFKDNYGSYVYCIKDGERIKQYVTITGFRNNQACVLQGIGEDENVLRHKEG